MGRNTTCPKSFITRRAIPNLFALISRIAQQIVFNQLRERGIGLVVWNIGFLNQKTDFGNLFGFVRADNLFQNFIKRRRADQRLDKLPVKNKLGKQ